MDETDRRLSKVLLEVTRTLSSNLDLPDALPVILDQLAGIVEYDSASIMLLEDGMLRSVAQRSVFPLVPDPMAIAVADLAHVQHVIQTASPVVISNVLTDPRWRKRNGNQHIRCWLGVPLVAKGECIGLLNLSHHTVDHFTRRDIELTFSFAAHAAIAIHNARLYAQAVNELAERRAVQARLEAAQAALQHKVDELEMAQRAEQEQRRLAEIISEVAAVINSTLDLDEVIQQILVQMQRIVGCNIISLKIPHGEGTLYHAFAVGVEIPQDAVGKEMPIFELERRVLQEERPLIVVDTTECSDWVVVPGFEFIRSWMGVPVIHRGAPIAIIDLDSSEVAFFNEDHIATLTAIANHAALAINNARLYQQVQKELAERRRAEETLAKERAHLAERVAEQTADLRAANAELARAARMKDEFLAAMSHELRTPLNTITVMTDVMLEQIYGKLNERQMHALQRVAASSQQLISLISDIIDVARIEAGQIELLPGYVELDALCRRALRLAEKDVSLKRQRIEYEPDPEVAVLRGDERRLRQILANLLSNAVKFTDEEGVIGLRCRGYPDRELVEITVWDTGIGIAQADMGDLFQPFVQLDGSLNRRYEGTGLGLTIVHRLVALHGGSVSVHSGPGRGTEITVALPWSRPADHAPSLEEGEKEETTPGAGSSTLPRAVLFVEPYRVAIQELVHRLEQRGGPITITENGREAIDLALQHQPGIIFLNTLIPELDALDVVRRMRRHEELANTSIIAVATINYDGQRERYLTAGADGYFVKPLGLAQAAALIESGHRREGASQPAGHLSRSILS
ncbi:MAG: GAF domain-containing protein [Caldilineaceae bacterium]|nr:GAF domain-containing protein [Caldilineaceae bacterium]